MSAYGTSGETTVLTCGSLSLTFPKDANIPRLNVRPGSNAVDVSLSGFSGVIKFEVMSSPAVDKPLNVTREHNSTESALLSTAVLSGIGPTLEQSLRTQLVEAPAFSQALPPSLTTTPPRGVSKALEEQVLADNESAVFFEEYASSQPDSGLFSSSQPYAASQALPASQGPLVSHILPTSSHGSESQPFHSSDPQSQPATQMPDSQLPDSSASQGESQTQPPDTPPLPHFEAFENTDVPESPPSSEDEDEHLASKASITSENKKQPGIKDAIAHPSTLARVESRSKHGKRVRFEEKPTLMSFPPRKKAAVSTSKKGSPKAKKTVITTIKSQPVEKPTKGINKVVPEENPEETPKTASPLSPVLLPSPPSSSASQQSDKNIEATEQITKVSPSGSPVSPDHESGTSPSQVSEPKVSEKEAKKAPTPQAPPMQTSPWQVVPVASEGQPAERWGATFTPLDEETVLLVGGESKKEEFFRDALEYRPSVEAWVNDETRPPSMPSARAWHSATRLDDIVFVFGGEEGDSRTGDRNQCNSALVYDKTYRTWYSPSISGSPPTPRAGHCAGLIPGTRNIALYGGIHGNRWLNDMYVLDDLCTWRKIRTTSTRCARPAARSYASLTAVSDFLVLFGGNNKSRSFNDVFLFAPSTMTWVEPVALGRAPKPRTGHCAVASKDGRSVIIYGGWDDQGAKRLFYSDVWLLRIESQTECHWNCIYAGNNNTDSPGPRAGAAMCGGLGVDEREILLFGGWYQASYYNDIIRLDVARNGFIRAQS